MTYTNFQFEIRCTSRGFYVYRSIDKAKETLSGKTIRRTTSANDDNWEEFRPAYDVKASQQTDAEVEVLKGDV